MEGKFSDRRRLRERKPTGRRRGRLPPMSARWRLDEGSRGNARASRVWKGEADGEGEVPSPGDAPKSRCGFGRFYFAGRIQ